MALNRRVMALIGALAGGSLYLLGLMIEAEWLAGRPALGAAVLAGVFFGGLLITAGPLSLARAALGALAVGLVVMVLFLLASLRFAAADGIVGSVVAMVSVAVLIWLPWPFLIAGAGPGWRDYPSLFSESWGIVVRVTIALVFTGIVWLVIFLSQSLLDLVGVPVIDLVIGQSVAPWLITGAVLGLAMSVVNELSDVLSPGLVLRLFRLLAPVVLVVMAIFLIALPVRGFDTIFGAVSSTAVLLGMVAAAVTLVTSALDQEDATAEHAGILVQSARALAAIMVLPAGLAAWALWVRVAEHGWTPERLLAATVAGLALAYGVFYLIAVLRGPGWMERIRQANIWMALATMAVAALWLSVLNPEGISARSQLDRIADGRTKVDQIDLYALRSWGLAGKKAVAALNQLAEGNDALAARLTAADTAQAPEPDLAAVQKALAATLPMQPSTPQTQALRDQILAQVPLYDLQRWQVDCDQHLPQGGPGCVMVVADFLPATPGDEAMLLARDGDGYMVIEGFSLTGDILMRHPVTSYEGSLPAFDQGAALIELLQKGLPPLGAITLNQLIAPDQPGLVFAP
ncbi:MAG: DUF4153 domain-containing protein [Cypionkella sp.]